MRLTLDTKAYTAFCLGEDQGLQLMENADELLMHSWPSLESSCSQLPAGKPTDSAWSRRHCDMPAPQSI